MVQLYQHVERAVLAAFGIPTPLLPSSMADGVAKRESMRVFRVQTLEPLGLLIAEELAATDPNMRSDPVRIGWLDELRLAKTVLLECTVIPR